MVLHCLDLDCMNDFHLVKLNYVNVHLPHDLHSYVLILFAVIFEAVATFAYLCMYEFTDVDTFIITNVTGMRIQCLCAHKI